MLNRMIRLVKTAVIAATLVFVSTASAEQTEPEVAIADLTKDVLVQIKRHREEEIDFDTFIEVIEERLNKTIDFNFIVRGVMGGAYKGSTEDQRARFLRVFKDGMIDTYANSFMDYDEDSVKQIPIDPSMNGRKRLQIKQVLDDGSVVLKVGYTLAKRPQGWMIINVNVNGINLGVRYRSQFAKAYKKTPNVDDVIKGWKTDDLRFSSK